MFTPIETTLGAILLHQAATGFLFKNGNVLGASGLLRETLFSGTIRGLLFVSGMAMSYGLLKLFMPAMLPSYPPLDTGPAGILTVATGLLTGLGTKWGAGCTSGHMLCGLSRLSARSLTAVMVFFPMAALTFNAVHGPSNPTSVCPGGRPCYRPVFPSWDTTVGLIALTASTIAAYHVVPLIISKLATGRREPLRASVFFTGLTFGLGLLISGMASPAKVQAFFAFPSPANWDPSLVLVIVFGILPSLLYNEVRGFKEPPAFSPRFELPKATFKDIGPSFVTGAALFGLAWGLSGVCPGPAILRAVGQPLWGLLWMGSFYVGARLSQLSG